MKNKKLILKIENHPVLVGRKAQLDPYQPGLLRKSKNDILEKIGAEYEKEIVEKLRNYFEKRDEKFLIFENIYFETGEYSEKLKVYRTIQIDILVITQYVIIPVEVKYISDAYCKRIAGGADSRSWNLIKYLSRSRMTNGVRQNRMHTQFTGELVDNIIFIGLSFIGTVAIVDVVIMIFSHWIISIVWNIIAQPFTEKVTSWAKKGKVEEI